MKNRYRFLEQIKQTLLLLVVVFAFSGTVNAQDIFEKYSNEREVTYVSIKPKMFKLLASIDINTDDPEAQAYINMVNSVSSFKTLVTENEVIAKDLLAWVTKKSATLEELMKVKDDGVEMTFYVKEGKDEEHVKELLMFVNGLSKITKNADIKFNGKKRSVETVVISLLGDIDLNQLSKLTKKMNLPSPKKQ